ncbi:hypothetical protein DFJ74DRAFT_476931 [Hyaloraphidium curvatum]|nr:hypothetical protein DFJ74DRAFT_476931 [Hyaloraphidium curvatum]
MAHSHCRNPVTPNHIHARTKARQRERERYATRRARGVPGAGKRARDGLRAGDGCWRRGERRRSGAARGGKCPSARPMRRRAMLSSARQCGGLAAQWAARAGCSGTALTPRALLPAGQPALDSNQSQQQKHLPKHSLPMKHATALLLASILLFAPLALASRTDELNAAALALASPHLRIQPRQNGCATDACLNFGMKVAGCMQGNSDPLAPAKCACDNSAQAVGCISTCGTYPSRHALRLAH